MPTCSMYTNLGWYHKERNDVDGFLLDYYYFKKHDCMCVVVSIAHVKCFFGIISIITHDKQRLACTFMKSFLFGILAVHVKLNGVSKQYVNEAQIQIPNEDDTVSTIPQLLKLLQKFEYSALCVGNPDAKFKSICERRKGSLVSISVRMQYGYSVYCFVDFLKVQMWLLF